MLFESIERSRESGDGSAERNGCTAHVRTNVTYLCAYRND